MAIVSLTKVIAPVVLASWVASYALLDMTRNRKIFGGEYPKLSASREWQNETHKKMDAWPREAAGPVAMNPMSRQNFHKV